MLNSEIEQINEDSLTRAELRKVGEIEKLARNVKQKMSTPPIGSSAYQPPLSPGRSLKKNVLSRAGGLVLRF